MIQCLGQLRIWLLVFILVFITTTLDAHNYPSLVKVKVGDTTTFRVSDAGSCSATIWVDNIENESLFSVTPNQGEGISVEFTIQANETPGETTITIHWYGEDVGSDEGGCTEDTRESGGVEITVRVTSDKVNSVGDMETAEAGDGHCDTGNNVEINGEDVPECTLRAAIQEVNAGGWEGSIEFDIPGPEPHSINVDSALPAIEKQTIITGFGLGSSKLNLIQNKVPTIELSGVSAGGTADGLTLGTSASGTLIEGLSIVSFGGNGVLILADNVVLKSNYIGTNTSGAVNIGNSKSGIVINQGAGNIIGGNNPDDRNVISGNSKNGVEIISGSLNQVIGNWIGLLPDSSGVLGNVEAGVNISEGSNHAVGAFTDTPGMAPGNVISGNGDGLIIDSNEIFVRGNVIGDTKTDPDAQKNFENINNGITVEGNTISIGGPNENEANIIAGNRGTGVLIQNDETRFVAVRRNQIYNNGLLGIDIMDAGVTDNDSLDVDLGPNGRLNFPEIKFVKPEEPLVDGSEVEVRGKLHSGPNATFEIDIYLSDACDDSKYGEGQTYLGKTTVSTNGEGNGSFTFKFTSTGEKTYDESKAVTAITVTPTGSTSEFSRCPRPTLLIVDADDNPVSDKKFAFYKVTNNKPIFNETFIDSLQSDEDGIIYKDSINADHDDRVLIRRIMHQEPSSKSVPSSRTKYSITLDNIQFLDGGELDFFKLDTNKTSQKTIFDHTTIAYNLAISVEWNASSAYIQDLQNSIRLASNYFYNVSDGQMRLDTVNIYKSKAAWNNVDVRYHASNVQWPMATVGGINQGAGSSKVYMPRRWFGNANSNRNLSVVNENALNLTNSSEYRTFIHEFGHYGLNLFDEYEFVIGTRCVAGYRYGYMDYHYDGNFSNEMSTAAHYLLIGCRNNKQFWNRGMSTSNYVKRTFETTIDGVKIPYYIANDRELPPNLFVFPGPNENFASLSYDVGSKIEYPRAVTNSPYSTRFINVVDNTGNLLPRARVYHHSIGGGYRVFQGETSDNGRIAILGHAAGDSLFIYTPAPPPPAGAKLITSNDEVTWYSAITTSNDEEIQLNQITGLRPILPDLTLTSSGFVVDILTSTQVPALPNVRAITADSETAVSVSVTENGFRMNHQLDDNQSGYFSIRATNLQGQIFMLNTPFSYSELVNDEQILGLGSVNGDFNAEISDSVASFSKVLILSSNFPVPESGLEESSIKVSDAHALQYEFLDESSSFSVNISYDEGFLETSEEELSIKIFRWDTNEGRWKQMGGQADTLLNVVSVTVAEPGIYAAFTSTTTTNIEQIPFEMPSQFRLHQNYPNPFNPTTTIPFDVAEATHVKLVVYDLLGREVATLVNEQKTAGSYTATFNSGRLSSGVYLYRIEMGRFTDTRRMMLVK